MHQLATVLLLLLVAAPPALAEDAVPPSAPAQAASTASSSTTQVGLGASLGSDSTVVFYVPIQLGRSFRIEPELGLKNVTVDSPGGAREAHAARFGIGLAWTVPVADQVRSSAGLRLQGAVVGYGGSGESVWGARAALVAGGEWLPVPRVSLGIEAQVGYAYAKDQWNGLGMVPGNGVDTAVLLLARIFIW